MRNGVMMALVAAFAVGTGVMGTLLWVENHPPTPITTPVAQSTMPGDSSFTAGVPSNAPVGGVPEGIGAGTAANGTAAAPPTSPPADLTRGMNPSQSALALANWYYDNRNWAEAITLYRATIQSGIDNPNVRTDLGNALRFAGRPKEALEQYRVAQKQNPQHEESLYNQGGLYALSLNDTPKAIAAWRTYLKRFPKGRSAADARGFLERFAPDKK